MFDFTPSELVDVSMNLWTKYGLNTDSIMICTHCGTALKSSECVLYEKCEETEECQGFMVYDVNRSALIKILLEVIETAEVLNVSIYGHLMHTIHDTAVWTNIIINAPRPDKILLFAYHWHNQSCLHALSSLYSINDLMMAAAALGDERLFNYYSQLL